MIIGAYHPACIERNVRKLIFSLPAILKLFFSSIKI
jgi:hypothetical protein